MKRLFLEALGVLTLSAVSACGPDEQQAETRSDAGADGGAEKRDVPYEPPEIQTPCVDAPFVQEFNHTTNEVEEGIGPLVSVILPPEGFGDFDRPTQVTPRGVVRHDGSGGFSVSEIDSGHPDLVSATAGAGMMALASPKYLYAVDPGGGITAFSIPEDLEILKLAGGESCVYVLTDKGIGRFFPDGTVELPAAGSPVATAAVEENGVLFAGGEDFVSAFQVAPAGEALALMWSLGTADGLAAGRVAALVPSVTLPQPMDLVVIGEEGVQAIDAGAAPEILGVPEFVAGRVPLAGPHAAVRAADGGFVVATQGGAYRIMDRGHGFEWRVYNTERWLPSEDLRAVVTDSSVQDGPIWFATAAGLASVTAKRITLEEKLSAFVARIVDRHDRDGAVADSRLIRRGDLSSSIAWDSDNDGSWTSYWLLAECFRWKVTAAEDAKAHFDKSLDAMLRLRDQTGTDWFFARAVIRKDGCRLDDCDAPNDGEWFTSPDGEWWVKGDTSNDEVIAHIFMMGPAYDLCADEGQKERIRKHIGGIVGGIVDHGYQLVDLDGKVTTFGQFDPQYVNEDLRGRFGDGGVRSAEILAGLTLAHYMTGEERFLEAKSDLIENYGYADNVVSMFDHPFHQGNTDGDEMGTMSFFTLLRYESDPGLRDRWLEGWLKTWEGALERQQAAFWTVVHAVAGNPDADMPLVGRWLRLAPADMIRWDMRNSQRLDLAPAPKPYKDGAVRSDGFIIPYDERRCDRWNTDQYRVDGGMGAMIEMDGADVLAPYWMARHFGFIVPADSSGK